MSQPNGTAFEAPAGESSVDPSDTAIAELEEKRAGRKAATEKARKAQYALDLAKVDELEETHGSDRVRVLNTPSFVSGLPTLVVVKTPSELHFKRFRQICRKHAEEPEKIGEAKDQLASVCLGYPDGETYARMKQAWPSIHDSVGNAAIKMGEAAGKA